VPSNDEVTSWGTTREWTSEEECLQAAAEDYQICYTSCFPLRSIRWRHACQVTVRALHTASKLAALCAACAINSNAINSTGLGHGQPASQPTDPSPLRLLAYLQVFRLKMSFFGNDDPFRRKTQ